MFTGYLVLVLHFLQFVSKIFKRWAIIWFFTPAVFHNLVTAKLSLKEIKEKRCISDNCQRAQPSEDARLARRQHYRAVRKYCAGDQNLECTREMFVR